MKKELLVVVAVSAAIGGLVVGLALGESKGRSEAYRDIDDEDSDSLRHRYARKLRIEQDEEKVSRRESAIAQAVADATKKAAA